MTHAYISSNIAHGLFGHEPVFLTHAWRWPEQVALSIDSRSTPHDSIFFAIKGELADGHDFIDMAFARGARVVIAQKNHPQSAKFHDRALILVDDPLETFSHAARAHLRSMPAQKLALTGSNGKTTTKEMLKSALIRVLGADCVFASAGNKNNHFGVPQSALEVKPEHKIALFEMGMNHAGEIAQLCKIVEPTCGLVTNISTAHEGFFSDGIDGVQRAKAELFDALMNHGHAVVNLDDERIKTEASKRYFAQVTRFGSSSQAELRILERKPYNLETNTQEIILQIKNNKALKVLCPLPGAHQASNVAAALAVIHALGLDVEEAALGIASMTLTSGRLSISKHKDILIINDGYNANPASMRAGIQATCELKATRRIAVVGAMGELGKESFKAHFELGELLAQHFAYILVCKDEARPVVKGAQHAGFEAEKIIFHASPMQLIEPLKALIHAGDAVFIKGSFSSNMAVIVQALTHF
jgi:UDP-N-acetylmuramoyl-tripeptide--D-alanyl-D-alanine ligase